MPQPAAAVRAALNALPRATPRQLVRTISTARAAPAKRPIAPSATRPLSQTHQSLVQRRFYKTVEEAKSRYRSGPFSWKAGLLFVLTGIGLVWYFESEKERMKRKRIAEATKGVGKPKVGGPFSLIDQNGNTVTHEDLKGRYALVYFGFTHCPDICPDELDKMARMFDLVEEQRPNSLTPVFVTCDPARDGPKELKEYLVEFHPKFLGLTGTYEQIKAMCKAYRVYFSTPSNVKPGQDYLVDHSIYFYLMDPDGDFVEALGRQHSPEQGAKIILDHMKDWRGQWRKD
ncbi:cytochrome c oxidase-like protein [Thermochaetoides thermophila DSM 1495]|uniref:Cytochrome c oxidase-like protein n=1 Tax=Chaetomium thermophilum (strain DSM 1495 / CBS 144.50 / IMI 039719) TaxID=759272 RepID=G0S1N2_CHATD|nr:cytochrome c oxidase-like protein [Thermochaetoides thermophila DSM 1495]EGS22942.1 cytochrome c oxidase-like protein [Thermochaetoides thermophila DSM 1495]